MNIKKRYKRDVEASLSCRDDSEKLIETLGLESEKKAKKGFALGWSLGGLGAVMAAGIVIGVVVITQGAAAPSETESASTPETVYKLGKISTQEAVETVSNDYGASLDRANGLEDFSLTAKKAAIQKMSKSEGEAEPEPILSYSADYVVKYATSWTGSAHSEWDRHPSRDHGSEQSFEYGYSETNTEKYHIDVVFDEERPYLHSKDTETYEYEETWNGESEKTTSTYVSESTYQDGKLYVSESSASEYPSYWGEWDHSGWSWSKSNQYFYSVSLDRVYAEYSRYFYSVSGNLQMVNDRSKNRTAFAELLQSEQGEILAVDGNLITLKVTYESGTVTYVYDMENYLFRSASFELNAAADCHDYDFMDADYTFTVDIAYSYNDVTPAYLSDEQIAEYRDYSKYGSHEGYDRPEKDGDSGYHGGHDRGDGGRGH